MWPLDLPAHEVLKLPGETVISWAVFDSQWYLRTYPDAVATVGGDDPRAVLAYYLESGQKLGHSPNRLFDEQCHRLRYPQIAEKVAAGHWRSAFDAYCRRGALDRSAHWLFDERGYRDRYTDLTNEVLAEFGIFNGYDHYLRHGAEEDRIGHVLFDPDVYLSHFDSADVAAIRAGGVLQHYLNRIESGEPELRTSVYFDPAWYVKRYPEVARDLETKRWKSALHHYLANESPTAFDPLASFSESWYLQRDPGLLDVVAARSFRNGYMHFLRFGAKELRSPVASIDLAWYATQPSVRNDLEQGRAPDAYTHWLAIGVAAKLPSAKPDTEKVADSQARDLFHQTATALLPIAGRFGYLFDCEDEPAVGVVMVARNDFAATMATIASLRASTALDIELIIVDLGSEDETRSIGQYVPGAKVLRFETDIGWSQAADAGRQLSAAQAILFLSSEAQVAPGSVERAHARLAADPSIGAVGGMILQAHGVIGQAGGIVWNNGGAHDYRRGTSPLHPEANFVRTVDFCAAALLLVRAALLSELDGFDQECAPGYEAVDLCLRIARAGFRVVYDPSVMIVLGDPSRPGGPSPHFRRKHAALLAEQFAPGGPNQVFARHAGATPPDISPPDTRLADTRLADTRLAGISGPRTSPRRVLFIDDTVPVRRTGSGFVRANDLVRIITSLGYAVTVFPMNGCDQNLARVFGDMPDTVEVMHTLSFERLGAFLSARPGYYDTVWVARAHNLARVRPILARLMTEGTLKAQIVLDTEAVTPHREAMQAKLDGRDYDLRSAMQAIKADAEMCQRVVAVTEAEADALRWHGFPQVSVIGHMIDPNPTPRPFSQRSGMLFVGAIHKEDSPNFDSLIWFVDKVLPLIEMELKWETRLTIAGYTAPGVDLSRFEHHPRITLRGQIANLDPLYDAHRVFVAPTRYAAGAPYKVLEAASKGLPVVATDVLREELDWIAEQDMVCAAADDPVTFAAGVVALYRDGSRWMSIREGALQRLRQENGRAAFVEAVGSVLAPPAPTRIIDIEGSVEKIRNNP
ncbi:MAG: putative glycosyltransferase [Rhodopila sp.]|nr:putative glycosyltransferase [Rhodopila sp.]